MAQYASKYYSEQTTANGQTVMVALPACSSVDFDREAYQKKEGVHIPPPRRPVEADWLRATDGYQFFYDEKPWYQRHGHTYHAALCWSADRNAPPKLPGCHEVNLPGHSFWQEARLRCVNDSECREQYCVAFPAKK